MNPIPKPVNWNLLPMYEKVSIYTKFLGPEIAPYIDKLSAKEIAAPYGVKVAPLVRVLKDINDIHQEDLKSGHILKAAHGCKWNIDLNETLNTEDIKKKLREWNRPYIDHGEPQYKFLTPKFYIEERITDKYLGKKDSLVYHIRCIYGTPIPIVRIRHSSGKANTYTFSWEPLQAVELHVKLEKPKNLDQMIEFASKMSKDFEFVRMDFYVDENDDIYFSEYTFTPSAGTKINCPAIESPSHWNVKIPMRSSFHNRLLTSNK